MRLRLADRLAEVPRLASVATSLLPRLAGTVSPSRLFSHMLREAPPERECSHPPPPHPPNPAPTQTTATTFRNPRPPPTAPHPPPTPHPTRSSPRPFQVNDALALEAERKRRAEVLAATSAALRGLHGAAEHGAAEEVAAEEVASLGLPR